jgi:hypothetical protein
MTRLLTRLVTRVSKPGLSGIGVQRTSLRVSLLVVCIFPTLPVGQNDIWLSGVGNWSTASSWSNGVPTSTSNVLIDNGNSAHSSVTTNYNGAQCRNLTIDSDDNVNMVDSTIFTLSGPSISNSGSITLNSAGFGTYFNFGGAVTLSGGGTLTMGNNSANYLFGYAQSGPGASLTNKSTIQGAGHIGWNGGIGTGNSFANQGTINANQSASAFPAYRQSPKQEFTGTGAATSASDSFVGLGMVDGTSDINRA